MSAVIFLRQPDRAFLLTDAAEYLVTGEVVSFCNKCDLLESAHSALTVIGPSAWQEIMVDAIRANFGEYDAVRDGIEPLARRLFDEHADSIKWEMKTCEVWVVGWSRSQNRPEGFTLSLCSADEWAIWLQREPGMTRRPFVPDVQHVPINANPAPTAAELYAAQFPTIDPEHYDPAVDLLHMMEIQRRHRFEHTGWPHLVGGHCSLATVDATGVTQRKVHEWPEDQVGQRIQPRPINWGRWRIEREAAAAGTPLTRLQAEVALRKQAKARRRVTAPMRA